MITAGSLCSLTNNIPFLSTSQKLLPPFVSENRQHYTKYRRDQNLRSKPCHHQIYSNGTVGIDRGQGSSYTNEAKTRKIAKNKTRREKARPNLGETIWFKVSLELTDPKIERWGEEGWSKGQTNNIPSIYVSFESYQTWQEFSQRRPYMMYPFLSPWWASWTLATYPSSSKSKPPSIPIAYP